MDDNASHLRTLRSARRSKNFVLACFIRSASIRGCGPYPYNFVGSPYVFSTFGTLISSCSTSAHARACMLLLEPSRRALSSQAALSMNTRQVLSLGSISRAMSFHAPFAQPTWFGLMGHLGIDRTHGRAACAAIADQGVSSGLESFALPAAAAALVIGAWFYAHIRASERIARPCKGLRRYRLCSGWRPYSYRCEPGLALQEHALTPSIWLLEINWRALLDWMNQHPALHPIFREAYASFTPQARSLCSCSPFPGALRGCGYFCCHSSSPRSCASRYRLSFLRSALGVISASPPADHPQHQSCGPGHDCRHRHDDTTAR